MVAQRWQAQLLPSWVCSLVCYWPLAVSLAKPLANDAIDVNALVKLFL